MLKPPDPPKQTSNTLNQVQDLNMNPQKRPRTSEDFLRFCDVVLSYANYPKAFYDEEEDDTAERKIESPLNSIGESARSNRSSTSSSNASVGEVETAEYDDTWGMITCWCGKPFAGRPMIECESCLIWLHLSCARVRKSNIPKHFKCSRCKPPKGRRKRQSSGNSEPEPLSTSTPTNSVPAHSSGTNHILLHTHHQLNPHGSNSHMSSSSGMNQLNLNNNHHQRVNLASTNSSDTLKDVGMSANKYGVASDNQSRHGHGHNSHNYMNGHSSSSSGGAMQPNHRDTSHSLHSPYVTFSTRKAANTDKHKKSPNKTPRRVGRPKPRTNKPQPLPISHVKHNSGSSSGSGGFSMTTPLRLSFSAVPPQVTLGLPTPSPSPSLSTSSSSSHASMSRGPPTLIPELSPSS